MPALESDLRRQLENVIIQARDVAEGAARSALQKRAVDAAEPFSHSVPRKRNCELGYAHGAVKQAIFGTRTRWTQAARQERRWRTGSETNSSSSIAGGSKPVRSSGIFLGRT